MSDAAEQSASPDAGEFGSVTYDALPNWFGQANRYWESAETTRLNQAHWTHADDESINVWLSEHLETLRTRSTYESKNNGIIAGMQRTHADDIWGQDGPMLQVISDDEAYNSALEQIWEDWWAAPTTRPNISGAALGKTWVYNLWRCGEFLSRIITMDDAKGPIKMRLWPAHPRRLSTPADVLYHDTVIMGVQVDQYSRPQRWYIEDQSGMGMGAQPMRHTPYGPDDIVHEFLMVEEDQVRGVPLLATGIQTAADMRDYDDQVQDAARLMADMHGMLYTDREDVPVWTAPSSTTFERRTYKTCPPGWKPSFPPATQPPVQYPDFRRERHIDLGRSVCMPTLLVRLDASKHSWASARLDMTSYSRSVACFQAWLSGTEKSTGTLNRLVDIVAAEGRFTVRDLRRRPERVKYSWGWPELPDVEPAKTQNAYATGLESEALTLLDILKQRKKSLRTHVEEQVRIKKAYQSAGLDLPDWFVGQTQVSAAAAKLTGADEEGTTMADLVERIEQLEAAAA